MPAAVITYVLYFWFHD